MRSIQETEVVTRLADGTLGLLLQNTQQKPVVATLDIEGADVLSEAGDLRQFRNANGLSDHMIDGGDQAAANFLDRGCHHAGGGAKCGSQLQAACRTGGENMLVNLPQRLLGQDNVPTFSLSL